MSIYEASITNPKKQLEFYKDLSEQLQRENKQLQKDIKNIIKILEKNCDELEATEEEFDSLDRWQGLQTVELEHNQALLKENQELKKRVETYEIEGYKQYEELNKMSFDIRKYKIQQKEFINFLEDNWKQTQDIWYIKILQKYKEITGENKEIIGENNE